MPQARLQGLRFGHIERHPDHLTLGRRDVTAKDAPVPQRHRVFGLDLDGDVEELAERIGQLVDGAAERLARALVVHEREARASETRDAPVPVDRPRDHRQPAKREAEAAVTLRQRTALLGELLFEASPLEGLAHDASKPLRFHVGLHEVVLGAALHHTDSDRLVPLGGHHHDRELQVQEVPDCVVAITIGHSVVEEHAAYVSRGCEVNPLFHRGSFQEREASSEQPADPFPVDEVVIHDQDGGAGGCAHGNSTTRQ